MRQMHRKFLTICLVLGATAGSISPFDVGAAGDRRFFGSYCGSHRETDRIVAFPCPFFPWLFPCPIPVHVDFSVSAHADYRETRSGNGLVHGTGRAEVVGGVPEPFREYIASGDAIPFVFSGAVTGRGRVAGSSLVPGGEPTEGTVELSGDGLELKLRGLDRIVTLRKDRCGNTEPTVTVSGPDHADFGEIIPFSATFDDDEAPPADEFLRWESDRDGWLANGLNFWSNSLSPGRHRLTFSAWDSGGLPASATHTVEIENEAPTDVLIHSPVAAGTYYAGVNISFRGSARDEEDGNLTGRRLRWTYGPTAEEIGFGSPLSETLPEGSHSVRLTASDSARATMTASVTITVAPACTPNCPPSVAIASPPDNGAWIAQSDPDQCMTLSTIIDPAHTWDLEDRHAIADGIAWTALRRGVAEAERITLGEGASIRVCARDFGVLGTDTYFMIRATATDSDGNEADPDEIGTLILAAPLI